MHSTNNLEDGYLGSGKILRYSVKKYGAENHKIEKLGFFEDREKLIEKEKEIVNKSFLKDSLCMNLGLGGQGGLMNEIHAKKFHAAGGKKVLQILNKKHCERLQTDEEYHTKFVEARKESSIGIKNPFYGKSHSEETKILMKTNQNQKKEKNSQFGTHWITNEKENKKIKGDLIPNGWRLGRK